jgi:hypothetical protein
MLANRLSDELRERLIVPYPKFVHKEEEIPSGKKRKRQDDEVIFVKAFEVRHGHRVVTPKEEEVIDLSDQ